VKHRQPGFTLTELAVVLAIVGLLLGSLMYTLSAQSDQRAWEATQRRLDEAKELLLSYAVVNGRLPCPATCPNPPTCTGGSNGIEVIAVPAGSGTGGTCSVNYNGFLPAATIGFSPTNSNGYAIDAWGNLIRYAHHGTGGHPDLQTPHRSGPDDLRRGIQSHREQQYGCERYMVAREELRRFSYRKY
jgi:prepilin-type N-terminal cleavage/methylation domain-containing protein